MYLISNNNNIWAVLNCISIIIFYHSQYQRRNYELESPEQYQINAGPINLCYQHSSHSTVIRLN